MKTVTALSVSRSIRSMRPRSSWVDHSGVDELEVVIGQQRREE
jgi:hypothetical protein